MRFIFPFSDIKKDTNIILYGASEEGYDFYRQLVSTGYCKVVLWVDRQFEWWRIMQLPVNAPSQISEVSYDLIVLTAEKQSVACSMKNDLIDMGVDVERIFWKADCQIKGNVAAGYDSERVRKEADEAELTSPVDILSRNMLDIVVRVLYAKDIIAGIDDDRHRFMYRKLMMGQNNGKEPTEDMIHSYFTKYSIKHGWEAFDQEFRNLVLSMKRDGFRRDGFIPLDSKGSLINGRHRLAAALALNINVWVRFYPFNGFNFCFDNNWLRDLGFSEEEISEAVNEFQDLTRR